MDIFEIDAVDLLEITKVVIGHDAKDSGHGWFLDKVVILVSIDDQRKSYRFICNR